MSDQRSKLVSVIIPCYNQAHYLGEAIASVLGQTYSHYEIIVVDDGSTDDTVLVATQHAGVRCLRKKNGGLAAARNTGLRESRGDYVIFLDADDRLLPDALAAEVSCLDREPTCAMAYGHVRLIDGAGRPLASPEQVAVESDHYVELLRRNFIWTPGAVIYRRATLDEVGEFNGSVSASADYDLNLRVARGHVVRCLDRVVLEYRRHGNNMSSSFGLMLSHSLAVLRAQRKHVRGNRRLEAALENALSDTREYYGEKMVGELRSHVGAHDWRRAAVVMLALLRHYPHGLARHAGRELLQFFSRDLNAGG
jgi:glycosyltransferase involved in cell wall biosynthesis